VRATFDSTARHLITTADERTWVFDRPVLFLGEWCRRYARRELWQRMHAVVAVPYGIDLEEKQRDYAYVAQLCERTLPQLTAVLNEQHGVSHSTRYWRIVLGHWLQRCFALLVNRWFAIRLRARAL
jgi:putative transferase (TIGR04331 family)